MTTFSDLQKGRHNRHSFYIATKDEAIAAIDADTVGHEYYIVRWLLPAHFHIYINLRAIATGIGEYGKISEGKSKKEAIAALKRCDI